MGQIHYCNLTHRELSPKMSARFVLRPILLADVLVCCSLITLYSRRLISAEWILEVGFAWQFPAL
jgi:hypothetical protein